MKKIILFLFPSFLSFSFSLLQVSFGQTVYDVTPGTKDNQIIFALANLSEIKNAEDVEIKSPQNGDSEEENIIFSQEKQVIKKIEAGKEQEIVFNFDVKREAPVNKKDTIEFIITDNKGIFVKKEFILSFTPPKEYKLDQNYPNPFNPSTTIMYQLPYESRVTLKVYDILGSEAASLVNEVQTAGYKEAKFGGSKYSSGVYIYRLTAESRNGSFTSVKKMIMIK
ncbi:MAG TPA: T9SS type A sorting domain-containing protein [Ignavibacteriaceae bacterium]|nr:T9SS type A sorting domain-containing protein [Ignavibacteriaceae bacterium]